MNKADILNYVQEVQEGKIYILEERVETLKKLDMILRSILPEDVFYDVWCAYGLPDGADDDDYYYITRDWVLYEECVNLAVKLIFDELRENDTIN